MISVLIIEDEIILGKNIAKFLARSNFNINLCHNGQEGLALLSEKSFDILLVDYNLPDMNGLQILEKAQLTDPSMKVIMMTGEGNVEIAVSAMKKGAFDYLAKPLALKELKVLLEKAASAQSKDTYIEYYQDKTSEQGRIDDIIGESSAITTIKQRLSQIIAADRQVTSENLAPVLIRGETGTGKELIAKSLHFDGPLHNKPFVEINCAAIPSELLESELFGHEKGAFTGAVNQRKGLFESANNGTLFIDEIGDMPFNLQSKLLKAIEEKKFRRLGDNREKQINVRIISATHQNLEEKINNNTFRQDLFYRLSVFNINLPSLREREDDVSILSQFFMQQFSKKYKKSGILISSKSLAKLKQYHWPGNIRELRNVLEQAVMLCQSNRLEENDIWIPALQKSEEITNNFNLPASGLNLQQLEIKLINQALANTDYNVSKAAKLLGLSRDTMRYRLDKYNINSRNNQ